MKKKKQTVYLTTRILERALKKYTKNLTQKAMDIQGYVVIAEGDWIVKKFKDGKIEKIKKYKNFKKKS